MLIGHTADLDERTLRAARGLLYGVFDDMTEPDWEHCLGGVHAIVFEGDAVIGHASVVQRRLFHGDRAIRTGYVEGVAVRADRQRRGIGNALMDAIERVIRRAYPLGALGASDEGAAFYRARGWTLWTGKTAAVTMRGVVATPEEDDCIFLYPPHHGLVTDVPLACDGREGDAW
jgi:aminoglycoside 2'-N-acetyltransferase I